MSLALSVGLLAVAVGTQAASSLTWNGKWENTLIYWKGPPRITLVQKGRTVTGRHALAYYAETPVKGVVLACHTRAGGTIKGTVKGRKLTGTITFPNAKGVIYLELSANGRELFGQMNVRRGPCKGSWGAFDAVRP